MNVDVNDQEYSFPIGSTTVTYTVKDDVEMNLVLLILLSLTASKLIVIIVKLMKN